MALNFHARLTADGKQAQSEVAKTGRAVDRMGDELRDTGREAATAAGAIDTLGDQARTTGTALRAASAEAGAVQRTHKLAAGSVGNLTAQFNDIGVMMAAGQNPLQLAVQQGTQITQVLGPMGAGQAVKALGTAFMSLLSPINLVTIGSIAAGAALVQWLTSSKESADQLSESLDAARDKIKDARRSIEVAETGAGSEERLALIRAEEAALEAVAEAEERLSNARGQSKRGAQDNLNVARERLRQAREELATYDELIPKAERLAELEEARGTATGLLETMREENELQRVALVYGEESVEYRNALAEAERRALENQLAALPVSEALKDEIRQAFENGAALSELDVGAGIRGAVQDAIDLGMNLFEAVKQARAVAALQALDKMADPRNDYALYGGAQTSQREQEARQRYSPDGRLPGIAPPSPPRPTRGRSGGGARAAREERDAVADLIDKYQEELDILRATDPVQQELLRHREDLATASAEERVRVEGLIGAIQREEQAKASAAEMTDFLRGSAIDLIPALTRGGDEAADAWHRVARAIEDAAWQALLLGEGPLAGIGGGKIFGGGLLGGLGELVSSLLGMADGGMIYGRGGPRADSELIRVSPGEFLVNADATSKNRALLESLNAGAPLRGLAAGGAVSHGTPDSGHTALTVQLVDATRAGLRVERLPDGTDAQGRRSARFQLADYVGDAMAVSGGGADRFLRQRGISHPRPKR